jgi:hypothetical protein
MKLIFLFICSFSALVYAEDKPERGSQANGRIEGRSGHSRVQMHKPGQRIKAYLEKLKTSNPKEYERLMKLKESDVTAFREEAFKSIRPKKDFKHGRPLSGNWMEKLQKENPEKYKKLMALREENPEKFRKMMRTEIGERLHNSDRAGDNKRKDSLEIRKLIQDYQEASDDKKMAVKEAIKLKLKEHVEADLKRQIERAKKMEEYLSNINKQIRDRQVNLEQYVEKRLERILLLGEKHDKSGKGKKSAGRVDDSKSSE